MPADTARTIDPSAGAAAGATAAARAGPVASPEHIAEGKNLQQLVQLRWFAVAGQLVTILVTHHLLGARLPLSEMLSLLALLAAFNLACAWRSRQTDVSDTELFAGLLVDVGALTGQLYYTGGVENPFIFLYLLQVAVGAVLLRPAHAWALVVLTSGCFLMLVRWHQPMPLAGREGGLVTLLFVAALLLCFVLNAGLIVASIARIQRNLRQRDARLAELRQRAAEEEHILRMGLLASGAAHELGTPLATLSVIVGDWARMAPFAAEPELREEIEEMQRQIARCKQIVGGILLSAGEARGEAPQATTLREFLASLVDDWRAGRPLATLHAALDAVPPMPIIGDRALAQMLGNVLDNATEASPGRPVELWADLRDDDSVLRILVRDRGPGFAPEMLAHLGQPYRSTKGRPGSGLGLFLSVNVARTLGGRLAARNRPDGGAEVEIRLPLAALTPRQSAPDAR